MTATELTLIIVLGCIALFLGIIGLFYMIIAYRRVGIVAKKIDYLVEDLTYKSEILTPVVEAMVKLANYSELVEGILSQNTESISKFVINNKETTHNFISKLRDAIKGEK